MGIKGDDIRVAKFIQEFQKPTILALNKSDNYPEENHKKMVEYAESVAGMKCVPISSKTRQNLSELFLTICELLPSEQRHMVLSKLSVIGDSHAIGSKLWWKRIIVIAQKMFLKIATLAVKVDEVVIRPRVDLENQIREVYNSIQEYDEILRYSDRPDEIESAKRKIEKKRNHIEKTLKEYKQRYEDSMPKDIKELADYIGL